MICWGSVATLVKGVYSTHHWIDFIIFGLAQGSIYALIAMGYTMVYGVLRMINFAHSEVFMSGPYTAYYFAAYFYRSGLLESHPVISMMLVFIVSMATSTLIAIMLERIAYRPLRSAPRLVPLITAIGASFFLQYMFRGLYGSGFQAYPGDQGPGGPLERRARSASSSTRPWSSSPRPLPDGRALPVRAAHHDSARPSAPCPRTRRHPP